MILEVYDLECLSNLFTYTGYCPHEDKYYQFVICDWRNDSKELWDHLHRDKLIQVGFNNNSYDYTLEHHFLRHFKGEYEFMSGQDVARGLYAKSQEIIDQKFSEIADKHKFIQQIDLYKIWHYDNANRRTSLKALEVHMRMDNIEEMPIHHSTWCKQGNEDLILQYNENDVKATYLFLLTTLGKTEYSLYKGKNKIKLRQDLTKKFGVNCLNLPDVGMGEKLMLKLYSEATNQNQWEVKKRKTHRDTVNLKDCIPYWANIKTPEFNNFLDVIKNTTVKGEKKEFEHRVYFHGYPMDFGLGGCHGSCKAGVYKADDEWMIVDLDVSSLYPSVARSLGLYPSHLGPEFMELYSNFIDKRVAEKHKPKNERDNVLIEGYKLILNGCYGKSKDENSFLLDKLYTFRTTIAGELFICMWTERLYESVNGNIKFLQSNTDGITFMIKRTDINKVRAVNEQLTKETTLGIEEFEYSMMIIRDVNSYIGVYTDYTPENNHIKFKGCFEIDPEYHKDPSMRIVAIALKEYFVNGIKPRDTICNHKDIFDFCLRMKANANSTPLYKYFDKNGELQTKKLDRTTRYYVSNNGGWLYKDFGRGNPSGVNVGYSVTLFNKFEEKEDYNINYNFYIDECNKIINAIETKQLSLFDDE